MVTTALLLLVRAPGALTLGGLASNCASSAGVDRYSCHCGTLFHVRHSVSCVHTFFPTQGCDEVANQLEDPFHFIPCYDIVVTYYRDINR